MILDTGVQVFFLVSLSHLPIWVGPSFVLVFISLQLCQPDLNPGLPLDGSQVFGGGDQTCIQVGSGTAWMLLRSLTNLSFKVYIQNLRAKQPEKPRRLFVTIMGKESKRFTRCFHGWGPMRTVPAWFVDKSSVLKFYIKNRGLWLWCGWMRYILWSLHKTLPEKEIMLSIVHFY